MVGGQSGSAGPAGNALAGTEGIRPIRLRSWDALLIGVPSTAFTMSPFCSLAFSAGDPGDQRPLINFLDKLWPKLAFESCRAWP